MIRSSLVHTIQEMILQGKSQRAVARELGLARNTVSKYAHGAPPAKPRPRRGSKLDPFRAQVHRWVEVDPLYNCETLFQRLQALGYTGKISIRNRSGATLAPARGGETADCARFRPSLASRCNSTGANSSTSRTARCISALALRRSWATRGCALSPLPNAPMPRR